MDSESGTFFETQWYLASLPTSISQWMKPSSRC